MQYESPTIELLGDSQMANVEGTAAFIPVIVVVIFVQIFAQIAFAVAAVTVANTVTAWAYVANWVTGV